MDLASMQDVVGCRAIVPVEKIPDVVRKFEMSSSKHRLIREYDYLSSPKSSGYRGYHLVYQYQDPNPVVHGRIVEIQIRSPLQHAWATTVEVVDTFTGQSLKSSHGSPEWVHFFRLMSALFAAKEGCAPVPDTPRSASTLSREIKRLSEALDVLAVLGDYGKQEIRVIERLRSNVYTYTPGDNADRKYVLLELRMGRSSPELRWMAYRDYRNAIEAYDNAEEDEILRLISRGGENARDIVLIRVAGVEGTSMLGAVKPSYPNYFADTRAFISELRETIG